MVMVKATKNSEAGILPGDPRAPAGFDTLFEQMGQFNEELVKAGVMLAADGLRPSSAEGKRVRFTGSGGENRRRRAVHRDQRNSSRASGYGR
jgi:hypothetical protein